MYTRNHGPCKSTLRKLPPLSEQMPHARLAKLIQLLQLRSYREGDFVLSSGKRSPYYIDARLTTMSAEGLPLIGALGFEAILTAGWEPDAVGGLTLGADPVAYAIAYHSSSSRTPIQAFTVRKQAKAHGSARQIEGPLPSGGSCVICEDVITTGASALQAAATVRAHGSHVLGVLAIVDRQEGGRQNIEATGLPVISLVTIQDLREQFR